MRTTLLAFHGYRLNGARMRAQLGELAGALAPHVELECPDAPHTCDAGVGRLDAPRFPGPRLSWWNATEDGKVYGGWERTRRAVQGWIERSSPVGILGFSQGAMLAAAVASLSGTAEMPSIRFVIMVAGRIPRAEALQSLFQRSIPVPSLHVWGDADRLTGPGAPALVERFDPATREAVRWPGPHVFPTAGPAADAIVDFVRRRH